MAVVKPTKLKRKVYAHVSEGDQLFLVAHYPNGDVHTIHFDVDELEYILDKVKEGRYVVLDPDEKLEKEQVYLWYLALRKIKGGSLVMKFDIGDLYITTGARSTLNPTDVQQALLRYIEGDWGELGEEDKRLNDDAVQNGGRILGAYRDRNGTKFWIITEADRSTTTILLPDEY